MAKKTIQICILLFLFSLIAMVSIYVYKVLDMMSIV